ncbi:MAG: hypothetical protein PQJ59_01220 [Spirochaetales bacterium]|nr:hypothetical protein [Spirochaetales bacterium]
MIKKSFIIGFIVCSVFALSAQTSVKGHSVNGLTGLMTTPTARIGWEKSDFGIDVGYAYLGEDGDATSIPRVTLSLFRKAEVSTAVAFGDTEDLDIMLAGKFQFYKSGGSSMAGGLDYSSYDYNTNINNDLETLLRPYVVATYSGDFFDAPAVTSMTFGWDLANGDDDGLDFDNFNYSMGFEMAFFPKYFKNFIYWMSDFANYSFSAGSGGATGVNLSRGIFNTGFRIDPLKDSKYKFIIDVVGTDMLDSNRGFMIDASFGMAF